jgi:hypothetical protein
LRNKDARDKAAEKDAENRKANAGPPNPKDAEMAKKIKEKEEAAK